MPGLCEALRRGGTSRHRLLVSFVLMIISITTVCLVVSDEEIDSKHEMVLSLCLVLSPVVFIIGSLLFLKTIRNSTPPVSHLADNMIISAIETGFDSYLEHQRPALDTKLRAALCDLIDGKEPTDDLRNLKSSDDSQVKETASRRQGEASISQHQDEVELFFYDC